MEPMTIPSTTAIRAMIRVNTVPFKMYATTPFCPKMEKLASRLLIIRHRPFCSLKQHPLISLFQMNLPDTGSLRERITYNEK